MPEPKQHITDLAHICHKKGIRAVIISPGSRSAPLIRAFTEVYGEDCISIVDERSAAYFALGMAVFSRQPVALICTSGTAVLNYAPAMAEAFHQHVPLLAITADRPLEWTDQQANQTIRQSGIYRNYVKASFDLPQAMATDDDLWHAQRITNEAINRCMSAPFGPVHINVPLTEPLYETLPAPSGHLRIVSEAKPDIRIGLPDGMMDDWKQARRIMIIHGQDPPLSATASLLSSLSADARIVVLAENIANVTGSKVISNAQLVLGLNRHTSLAGASVTTGASDPGFAESAGFPEAPDLILYSGGQVVSAALGKYLRSLPPTRCWRIGQDDVLVDTFQQVTDVIRLDPSAVYRALLDTPSSGVRTDYAEQWSREAGRANAYLHEKLSRMPFSDIRVIQQILMSIPEQTIVMAGNSSVIRYMQLFPAGRHISYYANRGVSGIDGCISTAAGIALASDIASASDITFESGIRTLVITGDQGFIYDSNALWNRELSANLRIVVLNNGGGGIFHLLKGPAEMAGFKKYMEADHPVNLAGLADAFQLDHFLAQNESDLERQWNAFIHAGNRAAVFEIRTDAAISASTYKEILNGGLQH